MTVTGTYSDSLIKDFTRKRAKVSKIRLFRPEPSLYIRLEQRGRGSRGSGRFHEIEEIYVNLDNELLAGFDLKEEGGLKRVYSRFGKLFTINPQQQQEEAII